MAQHIYDACHWCSKIIPVPADYDPAIHKPLCSQSCWDAEMLFMKLFSNKAILDREYLEELRDDSGED